MPKSRFHRLLLAVALALALLAPAALAAPAHGPRAEPSPWASLLSWLHFPQSFHWGVAARDASHPDWDPDGHTTAVTSGDATYPDWDPDGIVAAPDPTAPGLGPSAAQTTAGEGETYPDWDPNG